MAHAQSTRGGASLFGVKMVDTVSRGDGDDGEDLHRPWDWSQFFVELGEFLTTLERQYYYYYCTHHKIGGKEKKKANIKMKYRVTGL